MAISRKQVRAQALPHAATPIRYLTENGFSIVRVCELDPSVRNSPGDCCFVVQRDEARQRDVYVSFDPSLIIELRIRRRTPLSDDSMFWLLCAESCLATYLWEHDKLPPKGRLLINELSPDELMLALHWRDRD